MNTNKKMLIIGLVIIVTMSISGCNNKNKILTAPDEIIPTETVNNIEIKEYKTLKGLKQEFINAGFETSDNQVLVQEVPYADDGMMFELDGEFIEIYKFDLYNLSNEANSVIKQAKEGSVYLSGLNKPAYYNNGIIILRFDVHSQEEKIVEIFNNY